MGNRSWCDQRLTVPERCLRSWGRGKQPHYPLHNYLIKSLFQWSLLIGLPYPLGHKVKTQANFHMSGFLIVLVLVHGLFFSIWGTEVVLRIPHLLFLTPEMHKTIFYPGSYYFLVRDYSQYVCNIIWLGEEMCRLCKFLCPFTILKALILRLS